MQGSAVQGKRLAKGSASQGDAEAAVGQRSAQVGVQPPPLFAAERVAQAFGRQQVSRMRSQLGLGDGTLTERQPTPVVQRQLSGPNDEPIWQTEISSQVASVSEEIQEAILRLHSIQTVIKVASFADLVQRIEEGEFDYLIAASRRESAEPNYAGSTIGQSISHNSNANWRTGKIKKELQTARTKHGTFDTGHHKLPKSTLEWLYNHLTEEQWQTVKERLDLGPNAELNALRSLRSNLVFGPHSGSRSDDPGQGLDLTWIKDQERGRRRLSLRSDVYSQLATYIASIGGPPLQGERENLTEEEFAQIVGLLERAEKIQAVKTGGGLDEQVDTWVKSEGALKPYSRKALDAEAPVQVPENRSVRDLKRPEHQAKHENPPSIHWPFYVNIGLLGMQPYLELMSQPDTEQRCKEIEQLEALHDLQRQFTGKPRATRRPNWHHGFQYLGDGSWTYRDRDGQDHFYPVTE